MSIQYKDKIMKAEYNTINGTVQLMTLFPHVPRETNLVAYDKKKGQTLSPKRAKLMRRVCSVFELEMSGSGLIPFFVTITTCQHKTQQQDIFYTAILSKWFDNIKANKYMWVAERQDGKRKASGEATNDVHFHILMWMPTFFDIKKQVNYLTKRFEGTGTNVFHVDKVFNTLGATKYLSKYISKSIGDKQKVFCRKSQISFNMLKVYKANADKYIYRVDVDNNLYIEITSKGLIYENNFVSIWKI